MIIYVPKAVVENYPQATELVDYFNGEVTFVAIEDGEYE